MRVETRTKSNGEKYFSFVYWNGKKRVRLKQSSHPQFENRKEALQWAKSKEAEFESARARVLRKLKWKTQYYEFEELSDRYIDYCKKTQPNSWKCSKINLHHYVFPFFLDKKSCNNPNNWPLFYEDYKNWLEEEALTTRYPQRRISYSTMNHCIKTLNTFLQFLVRKGMMDPANYHKMTGFSSDKINGRESEDVLTKKEFSQVHEKLSHLSPLVATFFQAAYYTGMRFNEIYGLSIDDLFVGELEDEVLKRALDDHKIKYYGYIVLESQPKFKSRLRNSNGTIERKPLKGKKKISEKNNRIVPIIDKKLFNNLVRLYKKQQTKLQNRQYGSDPKDYVLFEDMNYTEARRLLAQVYASTKYKPKCYHCCRHTRCTELVGKTRDFVLARYWLGHARQETTLRYTHIYQQSARKARKNQQVIEFLI